MFEGEGLRMIYTSLVRSPDPRTSSDVQQRLFTAMRVAIACALLAPGAAAQQAPSRTIEVFVRDSATRLAIAGARVRATRDTLRPAVSDSTGRARLTIPMRPADTVIVTRRGYRRYEHPLANGGEELLSFDVSLAPAPQELAELRVEERNSAGAPEGRLADFERRRTAGTLGKFLTEADIDRRRPVRTTDLLRGLAGVRVIDSGYVRLVVSNRGPNPSLVSRSAAGSACVLRIMVDGVLRGGGFSLDELDPKELHGIEIYIGPGSIPPSFTGMQRDAWCGLIAVWSR